MGINLQTYGRELNEQMIFECLSPLLWQPGLRLDAQTHYHRLIDRSLGRAADFNIARVNNVGSAESAAGAADDFLASAGGEAEG